MYKMEVYRTEEKTLFRTANQTIWNTLIDTKTEPTIK